MTRIFEWVRRLAAAVGLLVCFSAAGSDLFVAANGTASGPGTAAKPYDLVTALSGSVGQAGDTFILRGGIYSLGHVDTQIHGTAARPITFRQAIGERAQVVGSFTVWGEGGYVIFRDFELYSGDTRRLSAQKGAGFKPTDVREEISIQAYAPNCSFINLVVHDSIRSGFYTSTGATNTLIYGCLVYNTGWASVDNAEGHSYYLQGAGEVSDNLGFNSTGAIFHIYANGSGSTLRNITMDGNVACGAGALQNVRPYRDWIVGVDAPSVTADGIVLKNNMGYVTSNPTTLTQVQIGREQANGSVTLSSNYWPMGVLINNWSKANVVGNVFAPRNSDHAVDLQQNFASLSAIWDNNSYARRPTGIPFQFKSIGCSFATWKTSTGFDSNSTYAVGGLKGTKVFVRPNRHVAGRANIVVYNWENLSTVSVDVSSIVTPGMQYEVRNAQNFYGPAVLSGTYRGQALALPMTGLTPAAPMASLLTAPPTGPTFNVFVLLPISSVGDANRSEPKTT